METIKKQMHLALCAKCGDNLISISTHTTDGMTVMFIEDNSNELTLAIHDAAYIDSLIKQLNVAKKLMAEQSKQEPHKYWRTEPRELKSNEYE
jgi:hypothetical protein